MSKLRVGQPKTQTCRLDSFLAILQVPTNGENKLVQEDLYHLLGSKHLRNHHGIEDLTKHANERPDNDRELHTRQVVVTSAESEYGDKLDRHHSPFEVQDDQVDSLLIQNRHSSVSHRRREGSRHRVQVHPRTLQ